MNKWDDSRWSLSGEKKLPHSTKLKHRLIETGYPKINLTRQCELLDLSRSSVYYELVQETKENFRLMELIDQQYLATPFYESRRMREMLSEKGYNVNRKRV